MHICERRTPIKDAHLWEMHTCVRCTPVGDACLWEMEGLGGSLAWIGGRRVGEGCLCEIHTCLRGIHVREEYVPVRGAHLREMHDEFPVLQAILDGSASEVDTDDVATH